MTRWRVDYMAEKNKHLGAVVAPDEKFAITEAMKTFHITVARRFTLLVTKIVVEAMRERAGPPTRHAASRLPNPASVAMVPAPQQKPRPKPGLKVLRGVGTPCRQGPTPQSCRTARPLATFLFTCSRAHYPVVMCISRNSI